MQTGLGLVGVLAVAGLVAYLAWSLLGVAPALLGVALLVVLAIVLFGRSLRRQRSPRV